MIHTMTTNQWDLIKQHVLAMKEHAGKRVVALFLRGPDGYLDIGSGICLEIESRFFIATAAHNILNLPPEQITIIGGAKMTDLTPQLLGSGLRGGRDGDSQDIAWLEVHAKAAKLMERTLVKLDQVSLAPINDSTPVLVCGFPCEHVKRTSYNNTPWVQAGAISFVTRTISGIDPKFRPDHTRDLFLEYHRDLIKTLSAEFLKQLPAAEGLSGGGIWTLNANAQGIWTPEAERLVAIEYSWNEVDRWLRATLMGEWLQMLRADVPEVACAIDPVLHKAA